MTFALLYSLWYAREHQPLESNIDCSFKPNGVMCGLSIGFSLINVIAVGVEWFVYDPILEYITLFYGVYIGYYAVFDIYDDLITRTADGSDAVACSKAFTCCPSPKCVGMQFGLVAVFFQALALYLALVWRVRDNK